MNTVPSKIEVSIGSALEYLDLVQTITDSITSFMGFGEDSAHWVGMSVRESVTNAIQHGNKLDESKKVDIRFEFSPDHLDIWVRDQGNGFKQDELPNPLEPEILKVERKDRLGADFVQTQAVYDVEVAKRFMNEASHVRAPILIGIAPFKSLGMMEWMVKFVPGIVVSDEVQERLRRAREKGGKEGLFKENVEIFGEFIHEVKKTTNAAGIHIMAIGFESIVPHIIERAGVS